MSQGTWSCRWFETARSTWFSSSLMLLQILATSWGSTWDRVHEGFMVIVFWCLLFVFLFPDPTLISFIYFQCFQGHRGFSLRGLSCVQVLMGKRAQKTLLWSGLGTNDNGKLWLKPKLGRVILTASSVRLLVVLPRTSPLTTGWSSGNIIRRLGTLIFYQLKQNLF